MLDAAQAFIEKKKQKLEHQAREKQERGLDHLEVELRRQVKEIYQEAELREYEQRKQEQEAAPEAPALEPVKKSKRISRRRSSASNRAAFRSGRSKTRSARTSGVRSGRSSTARSSTRRRGQSGSGAAPIVIGIAMALVVIIGLAVVL